MMYMKINDRIGKMDFYKNANNGMVFVTLENANEGSTDPMLDDLFDKGSPPAPRTKYQ